MAQFLLNYGITVYEGVRNKNKQVKTMPVPATLPIKFRPLFIHIFLVP
jgi:hypothetical protein